MNAAGLITLFLLLGVGIIVVIACLIMVIIAIVKKSKRVALEALAVFGAYVILLAGLYVGEQYRHKKWEDIPLFAVENNTVTILGRGTGSKGSCAAYALSKEGVIEQSDEPFYRVGMLQKFGYEFTPVAEGKTIIGFAQSDFGQISFIDFYEVTVDENLQVNAELVKRIDAEGGKLKEEIPEEYSFIQEIIG